MKWSHRHNALAQVLDQLAAIRLHTDGLRARARSGEPLDWAEVEPRLAAIDRHVDEATARVEQLRGRRDR